MWSGALCGRVGDAQAHRSSFSHTAAALHTLHTHTHAREAAEVIAQKYLHAALSPLFVYQGGAIAGDFATHTEMAIYFDSPRA